MITTKYFQREQNVTGVLWFQHCTQYSQVHNFFGSANAFATANLTSLQTRICSKIYFKLLEKITHSERARLKSLSTQDTTPAIQGMPDHEKAVLRYVAGATIHKVTKDLKECAQRHMVTNV